VFSYIEQHLNIPAILDAAAVGRGHVDERSMLTYLSFLYNVREQRTHNRASERASIVLLLHIITTASSRTAERASSRAP